MAETSEDAEAHLGGSEKGSINPTLESDRPGLELVKDAYYRYTDIVFEWHKVLNRWQRNALMPLINATALTHPDHPLHKAGEDGITLFLGKDSHNHQRLLFSLAQIEYLQYYIHELRLTDPKVARSIVNAETAPDAEEGEDEDEKVEEWIPLLLTLMRPEEFASIEPINLPSASAVKKEAARIQKHNKAVARDQTRMVPSTTPSETAREEARVDNRTPGHGLRRGPMRDWKRRSRDAGREEDYPEGTGWGGFPLVRKEMTSDEVDNAKKEAPEEEAEKATSGASDEVAGSVLNGGDATKADGSKISSKYELAEGQRPGNDRAKESLGSKRGLSSGDDSSAATDPSMQEEREASAPVLSVANKPAEDAAKKTIKKRTFPEDHYFHAQQAVLLASQGGLAGVIKQTSPEVGRGTISDLDPKIGRSLFVALNIVTWEADPEIVLEVGWAAVWWQSRSASAEAETESPAEYEETRDHGHFLVQDHMLHKRNGLWRVDNRDKYSFGTSLPVKGEDLAKTVKQLVMDLSAKAGGGPTYLVIHSTDQPLSELSKIGFKTADWMTTLKPHAWEYPSYAAPEGVGKAFVIDTVVLFGAIEAKPDMETTSGAESKTAKTIEAVTWIMLGQEAEQKAMYFGNAGNDAYYTLEIFLNVLTGLPLEDLREDYRQSQARTQPPDEPNDASVTPLAVPGESGGHYPIGPTSKDVTTNGIHSKGHNHHATLEAPHGNGYSNGHEHDSDSEDDRIQGVYFEDEEGNVVTYDDDDDG